MFPLAVVSLGTLTIEDALVALRSALGVAELPVLLAILSRWDHGLHLKAVALPFVDLDKLDSVRLRGLIFLWMSTHERYIRFCRCFFLCLNILQSWYAWVNMYLFHCYSPCSKVGIENRVSSTTGNMESSASDLISSSYQYWHVFEITLLI